MPNLTAEQKSIKVLFQDKKSIFLIPDFQRPYAWEENECQKLWDDLWEFAFPDNDTKSFNESSEYYLGSIIAYRNNSKFEIIDGQFVKIIKKNRQIKKFLLHLAQLVVN